MKPGITSALISGIIIILSCGGKKNVEGALDTLIESEREFAKTSVEKGIKAAFLEYLGTESIVFRPRPVDGIQATEASKPSPASLQWAPEFAAIAASGEMGYTTGPWEYRPAGVEDTTVFYGHFISVWKRQDNGDWKVALDIGVSNPRHPEKLGEVAVARSPAGKVPNNKELDLDEERLDLLILDRECSQIAEDTGMTAFYREYGAESLRFFRDGILPITGKDSASEYYSKHPGLLSWVPFDAFVARSADLGYTYGSVEFLQDSSDGQKTEYGYYVRIWRKTGEGDWKIAVDVVNPAPPPDKDES